MITVEATEDEVRVRIPTREMSREEVQDFVDLLRLEVIVRKSKMTAEQVRDLSNEVNADWWTRNAHRFVPKKS